MCSNLNAEEAPTYHLINFFRNLHENKEILAERGGGVQLIIFHFSKRTSNEFDGEFKGYSMDCVMGRRQT